MTATFRKKLTGSAAARWTALILVSFTMLAGYVVADVMSPLKQMLEQQLGWSSTDFGLFNMGYGLFNVFLFMLIFAGMILDRIGPRITGSIAVAVMLVGTFMQYAAVTGDFGGATIKPSIGGWEIFSVKKQVFYAMSGFAVFGVGIEMIGITASKIVVKWFTGHSLALAMGLNVAAGRIGTMIAMFGTIPFAKWMGGSIGAPILLCMALLVIGLLTFLVFSMMDARRDRESGQIIPDEKKNPDDAFRMSDILKIARIRGFWYITLLCLLFYSAVFPFMKYATDLMIQKFGVSPQWAGTIPALIPFGNLLLTPLFGLIYDYRGRGATIMIIGSVLLVVVHTVLSVPFFTATWIAVAMMILLGGAFSLVPSAMWPSIPKIVPFKMLGTSYGMIFWIQNIGLSFVPLVIGIVLDRFCVTGQVVVDGVTTTQYDYSLPMALFAGLSALSIIFALLLRREDRIRNFGLEEPNIKK